MPARSMCQMRKRRQEQATIVSTSTAAAGPLGWYAAWNRRSSSRSRRDFSLPRLMAFRTGQLRKPLRAALALPSEVTGPVDLRAFARLAAICFAVAILIDSDLSFILRLQGGMTGGRGFAVLE